MTITITEVADTDPPPGGWPVDGEGWHRETLPVAPTATQQVEVVIA